MKYMNDQEEYRPVLVRADSRLRNKSLALGSLLVLLPVFLLWALPSAQVGMLELFSGNNTDTVFRLLIIFYSLFSIIGILLITTGLQLIQAGRRVRQSGRFPAPEMRVFLDTWLVTGSRASLVSMLLTGIGVLIMLGGLAVPIYFHALLLRLLFPAG